jgi:thiamine-phosphate pyrophosphorylase
VYLVTDRRQVSPGARSLRDEILALERFLDEALEAAVDVIQLRERDLEARVLASLVVGVRARAHGTATRVLVNDRADVALATDADGVHLRADGLPTAGVRALRSGWTIGRSVHPHNELRDSDGADYLLFGTVFPSASKPEDSPVAGVAALAVVVSAVRVPVIAIGGVTPARVAALVAAGAAGVAGIGMFAPPPAGVGPARAVRALREAFAAAC